MEMPGCEVGDLRSTGSSHTEKDGSTGCYSVVSMVKNTRCVLVRISIEKHTHLSARQGSPIFLICFFFFFFPLSADDITGLVDISPRAKKRRRRIR